MAWKLAQSISPDDVFALLGNGGTSNNVPVDLNDFETANRRRGCHSIHCYSIKVAWKSCFVASGLVCLSHLLGRQVCDAISGEGPTATIVVSSFFARARSPSTECQETRSDPHATGITRFAHGTFLRALWSSPRSSAMSSLTVTILSIL